MSRPTVLETRSISKWFGLTRALYHVDFTCLAGEIHALVGQNGAGKSTLMNIFAGVFHPDEGQILLDGSPVSFSSPLKARQSGVHVVYQVPDLIPHLNVAENLYLGQEPRATRGILARSRLYEQAEALCSRLQLRLPLKTPVGRLPLSQQQMVTIARAFVSRPKVLALDEPTASLSPPEADHLFELVFQARREGVAIIYISHHLEEVLKLADRVSVLRDGQLVSTRSVSETSRDQLVRDMTGGQLAAELSIQETARFEGAPSVLKVKDLQAPGLGPFSFEVRAGEILGIGGLVGSGRSELLRLIFGADRPSKGAVFVHDRPLKMGNPLASVAAGMGFVTEDRQVDGLVLRLPVKANLSMTRLSELKSEDMIARQIISELGIRGRPEQSAGELSGGNQQKVVLGKWFKQGLSVLLVDEPTQGVDVKAKEEIHRYLRELAHKGLAVVLVSSELSELLALSHRIIVMREGRISAEFVSPDVDEERILSAALG